MVAINNFAGHGVKKSFGRIAFEKQIGKGLRLIIAESGLTESFNPCLQYEAGIAREINTSSSGVCYFFDAATFCCSSQEHINEIRANNKPPYFYLKPPVFKEKFESEEICGDGFRAYTIKDSERGDCCWREVWKVSFDNFKEFIKKI